jgi:hypothetical protein
VEDPPAERLTRLATWRRQYPEKRWAQALGLLEQDVVMTHALISPNRARTTGRCGRTLLFLARDIFFCRLRTAMPLFAGIKELSTEGRSPLATAQP